MLTAESCATVVDVLDAALISLPPEARAVRAQLKTTRTEYDRALKNLDHAVDLGLSAAIVPVGGVERGEVIVLGAGPCPVRRISETGVEIQVEGYWTWENVSGRSTPVVVVVGPR